MGADIKALRTRMRSVDSTMHLTRAMGLVASSKIRRASEAMLRSRAYDQTLSEITDTLLSCPECARSPYLKSAGEGTRLIVIAGDRGLAGGYNANIFRLVRDYSAAEIIPLGKRACDRFGMPAVSSEHFSAAEAHAMAEELCRDFLAGAYGRLGIVGTRYVSMLTQEPYVRFLLPLSLPEGKKTLSAVFEPDEATILSGAVPEFIAGSIMAAVRESFACEVAARRTAMDSAGKNAAAMIDALQLQYNRARQGAITQEITEIVAGSDA